MIINELSKPLAFFISIIFHLRNLSNVIKRFRSDFKDWNESDIRLFSCIVAQFDTVLILKIFNLPSKESVYMRKVRLKDRIRHSGSTEKERYLLFF